MTELLVNEPNIVTPFTSEQAHWLGAIFSLSGTISFSYIYDHDFSPKKPIDGYPYLSLGNREEIKIKYIKDWLNGSKSKRALDATWIWQKTKKSAASIALEINPYTPSRQPTIERIIKWRNTSYGDAATRLAIASEDKQSNRANDLTADDYMNLVDNPFFLAGLLDWRGCFETRTDLSENHNQSGIKLHGVNRPLLEAMEATYGGKIYVLVPAGTEVTIKDHSFVTVQDELRYEITNHKAIDLAQKAQSSLVLVQADCQNWLAQAA
jgi:hypothetical protein